MVVLGLKMLNLMDWRECREKFIKREYYIGNFYYKRGKYKSCLERYEGIITASGEIKNDITKKAMYELGVAYGKVGDKKNQERIQKLFSKNIQNQSKC